MVEFELTEARWEEDNSIIDKLTKLLLGINYEYTHKSEKVHNLLFRGCFGFRLYLF